MSQSAEVWPAPCPYATALHTIKYGPPPEGTHYECEDLPVWPPGSSVGLVYLPPMADTYRLAVTWLYGSPATNLAVTTHDWRWTQDGAPVAADYEAPQTKMDAFMTAMAAVCAAGTLVTSYDWHLLAADGSGPVTGVTHHADRNISFTGSSMLPPQIACSVTEITDVRRRWGRFYIPFLADNNVANGRLVTGLANVIATAGAALEALTDPNWVPQVYGSASPSSIPVRSIRVDNTADVIRSRRWAAPTERATVNL